MEPSKEAIAIRITRLNRQILGKVTSGANKLCRKTIDREALLDALTVLYDECNDDPVKKCDELVKAFVDVYRSTLAELRRTRVCLSDFEILHTIGRGHFGEVHMVREKQTSDVYALKTLRKEQSRSRTGGAPEDERDVLASPTAPWLPKLQYAFQDSNNLYLVMELCSGGDLSGLLSRRHHPLSEKDAAFYIAEVTQALRALHSLGYVHRDLKPSNILIDRCGHIKLGDFGSCARLSEGSSASVPVGTPDYVAPELLAAAECAGRHSVCLQYCRGIMDASISACDYWSLGVIAFELVTLRRPFSTSDEDNLSHILANIQSYETNPELSFEASPNGPSTEWRELVSGLLRVKPGRRFSYLDTMQHVALAHLSTHHIRDQAPPWVPCVRGPEDATFFNPEPRPMPPPSAALFRARPPFAGQLPFVGFSYVASEENEDNSSGFNASHDCTAIDLATFKSAEKLAVMRAREIASLQNKLAASEAHAKSEAERVRQSADDEAERTRAKLQAEITALSLQNKRLERQVEIEKEERMALERTNQDLKTGVTERQKSDVRVAQNHAAELKSERDRLKEDKTRLEHRIDELQSECNRALNTAETAKTQQQHYKDTIAKERAFRRQTLSGADNESREATAKVVVAEANLSREVRAKESLEKKLEKMDVENTCLKKELKAVRKELAEVQESLNLKQRDVTTTTDHIKDIQAAFTQERVKNTKLTAQVQELEKSIEESGRREASLEDQCARTEARLNERLEAAEVRATSAIQQETKHREKVNTLEQLVRQLEREVSALEKRTCASCDSHQGNAASAEFDRRDAASDTESVGGDSNQAVVPLLKEQLERAEAQMMAKTEEIAALRLEARSANLAKWRKEKECNELSVEVKSNARDIKRLEERLATSQEARRTAEKKASALQTEMEILKPQHEKASAELERLKQQSEKLLRTHETIQAENDRSRNDIRKLKSELQYSEHRRLHAEEQEELSSRERLSIREQLDAMRAQNIILEQNNKALQEACSLLEDQLTDLEKLTDLHEIKNKELEEQRQRMRSELESCSLRLREAERAAAERLVAAGAATRARDDATESNNHAQCQLQLLRERLESRESLVSDLESRCAVLESEGAAREAAMGAALRRARDLHEECSMLRTRAHDHHAQAMQLQAALQDAQEEVEALREASEAAAAWWRTRETKADATLRQQAKLIDFLQAKLEEAGRKKQSLSNKLFGRSGRRTAASPPLRRVNRELREEVDRLRAQLSSGVNGSCPPTPRRDKTTPRPAKTPITNRISIDTPDGIREPSSVVVVWPDGSRDRMRAQCTDGVIVLTGDKELRGRLYSGDAISPHLSTAEANRAFVIKLDTVDARGGEVSVIADGITTRAQYLVSLRKRTECAPTATSGLARDYTATTILTHDKPPVAALYIAPNAIAVGGPDGLHSMRGQVRIELDDSAPMSTSDVTALVSAAGRVLLICDGMLLQGGMLALGSALRRAGNLKPTLNVNRVMLPDCAAPQLIKSISGGEDENGWSCVAVSSGRRVALIGWDGATASFRTRRALSLDRPPAAIALTRQALYIASERLLKLGLPSGALESFASDDPLIAAAVKKRSSPKSILVIRNEPFEILVCYAECGVFLDAAGKRTRNEDPRWISAVHSWEYVAPFLYVLSEDKITISYITEDSYRTPPCTCDAVSLASTPSDCYMPHVYNLKVKDPTLLGATPNGIIIRSETAEGYSVSIVEGLQAFRSIGASVESLETVSDTKGSCTDLRQSLNDVRQSFNEVRQSLTGMRQSTGSNQDVSRESVEISTGFLADIRNRARQMRSKNRQEECSDDVIKKILTTEVGLKPTPNSNNRRSHGPIYDSETESESEERTVSTKDTADLCAEMFTRQVHFK